MNTAYLVHATIYLLSFIAVWIGAGLIVSSITSLSRQWRLPAFTISFFLLGIMTSLPELTIGGLSLVNGDPAISVGNLLGGIIVLFLLVIPLLGLLGNGITIPHALSRKDLLLVVAIIIAPSLLTNDLGISPSEGLLLLLLYVVLFVVLLRRATLMEKMRGAVKIKKHPWGKLLGKTVVGVVLLLGASHQIIQSTLYFAEIWHMSPFLVSLLVVSLGTNIPELSIVLQSVLHRRKDVALADYLGSAAANTPIMGALALFYGKTIPLPNHALYRFVFLTLGLVLFVVFARSKNTLSRSESIILLLAYAAFLWIELGPAAL